MKIKSPEDDTSVLLLRAGFVEKKSKDVGPKAGQNGAIEYNILGGGKTEISFAGLQCPPKAKSCEKEYKYTAVTATRI